MLVGAALVRITANDASALVRRMMNQRSCIIWFVDTYNTRLSIFFYQVLQLQKINTMYRYLVAQALGRSTRYHVPVCMQQALFPQKNVLYYTIRTNGDWTRAWSWTAIDQDALTWLVFTCCADACLVVKSMDFGEFPGKIWECRGS